MVEYMVFHKDRMAITIQVGGSEEGKITEKIRELMKAEGWNE